MTDYRFPFDEVIFFAINRLGWAWLDQIWVLASSREFAIAVIAAIVIWLVGWLGRGAIRPVLQASTALLLTDQAGAQLLKPFFHRLRPSFALPADSVRQLVEMSSASPAMPSLHAANSFAFAVALGLCVPGTARMTLPIAAIISLSRIGVGVHWPTDILAGALYGSAVGWLIHWLFSRFTTSPKLVATAE